MSLTVTKTLWQLLAAVIFSFGILSSTMGDSPVAAPIPKKPIPPESVLKAASQSVDSLFEPKLKAAKLPHQKAALVRSLLDTATLTVDDVPSQYVLLQKAVQIASEVGNIPLAFQAIEQLDANFEGTAPMRSKAELCKRAATTSSSITTSKEISRQIVKCISQAVDAKSFEDAVTFLDAGMAAAKRQNAPMLIAQLEELSNDVKMLSDQFAQYTDACKRILEGDDSKEVHKVVGTYLALHQCDWINGVRHLTICEDDMIRPLVVRELEPPVKSGDQVQLADDWWQLSEKLSGAESLQARAAAFFWYQKCFGQVNGLAKLKIQARLATVSPICKSNRASHAIADAPAAPSNPEETPKLPQKIIIDILQTIVDPTSHAKKGKWQIADGELVAKSSRGVFSLPVRPSGSYCFDFEVFRDSGSEVILVTLPVAKRQVYVELSCQGGAFNAMSFINGRHSDSNGTASNTSMIRNGEWNSVRCDVNVDGDKCRIRCDINKKGALEWSGEWRDLGIDANWGPSSEDELGLASISPGVRLRRLYFIGREVEKRLPNSEKADEIRLQVQQLLSETEQRVPNHFKNAMTDIAEDVARDMHEPKLKETLTGMFSSYVKAMGVCGTPSKAKFPDLLEAPDSQAKIAIGTRYSVAEGIIAWYHFDPAFDFFVSETDKSDMASRDIIKEQFEITIAALTYAKDGRMFAGLPHEVDVNRALEDISNAFARLKMGVLR